MTTDWREFGNPGSARFDVEAYPFYQLNRTASRYNRLIGRLLRAIDLEIPAWRVLMILGQASPQPVGEVAEKAVINISTMVRLVERMRKSGYLQPNPSALDGRVTEIALTALGREKLAAARRITAPFYEAAIAGFSPEEFRAFITLTRRLHDNITGIDGTTGKKSR